MKHTAIAVMAVVLLVGIAGSASAFVINANGNLAEWGVTPFSPAAPSQAGWIPTVLDQGIAYDQTDNNVLDVNHLGLSVAPIEQYDFEALYSQVTASTTGTTLNLAMVTSFNWQGDLGYQNLMAGYSGAPVNRDAQGNPVLTGGQPTWNNSADRALTIALAFPTVGTGSSAGWNYAVRMWEGRAELFNVGTTGPWESAYWFTENNPVGFIGNPTPLETVVAGSGDYAKVHSTMESPGPYVSGSAAYPDTWIYEVSFDLAPGVIPWLTTGQTYMAHSSPWCGNDNLTIAGAQTVGAPNVPEPASLVLLGLCVVGVGTRLRKRKCSGE